MADFLTAQIFFFTAQYSDLAYLGYKKDFPIFGFFGLVGKFLTWEWAVVK